MVRGNRYKTIRWSFLESLEPPRVVQVRCPDMVSKTNLYGQVTVRMHTRQVRIPNLSCPGCNETCSVCHCFLMKPCFFQSLAIYDRFGRLMHGGEQVPKDVLEYVVFERHLANPYSPWRLHGKIVPAWAPPRDPILKVLCY